MAFGPILRLEKVLPKANDLTIELAPLVKTEMAVFVKHGGMQRYTVIRYLARSFAPVEEDELEWFEKVRQEKTSVVWGIWVIKGETRQLIGTSGLHSIEHGPTGMKQATSGVLIFDQSYWGLGIASAIHKVRTWYAFTILGLTRIESAVVHGNVASRKALEKSGYALVFTERNTTFGGGVLRHQDNLACLNPLNPFWKNWWGADRPTKAALTARKATKAALAWAEQNVRFS